MPDSEPDTPGELAGDDKRIAHLLLVNDDGVREVFSRPRFWAYLAQVIERWKFTVFDAKARAFQTDRDLILGSIWLVLSPILDGLMYGFIFGVILRTSRGIENFIGYVMIGITFFNMMNGAMQMGCGLVRTFKGMLGSFDMPAASGVISRNLRLGFDSIIPAIVAVIIGLITSKNGISPWIITLIPLYILINMFGLGLMFVSARLTAQIPDLKALFNLAGRAWFFISGVFFSIDRFVDHEVLKGVMESNPAYIYLQAVRTVVLQSQHVPMDIWLQMGAWSVGMLVFGFVFFWHGEGKYARVR